MNDTWNYLPFHRGVGALDLESAQPIRFSLTSDSPALSWAIAFSVLWNGAVEDGIDTLPPPMPRRDI